MGSPGDSPAVFGQGLPGALPRVVVFGAVERLLCVGFGSDRSTLRSLGLSPKSARAPVRSSRVSLYSVDLSFLFQVLADVGVVSMTSGVNCTTLTGSGSSGLGTWFSLAQRSLSQVRLQASGCSDNFVCFFTVLFSSGNHSHDRVTCVDTEALSPDTFASQGVGPLQAFTDP